MSSSLLAVVNEVRTNKGHPPIEALVPFRRRELARRFGKICDPSRASLLLRWRQEKSGTAADLRGSLAKQGRLMLEDASLHDNLTFMNHVVHELARAAGQAAGAERVYVFGSQARGEARADSDLDLALIIADDVSPRQALRAAIAATSERKQALDVVVIAHSTWAQGRSLLAREVRQQGVLVYGN